MFTRPPCIIEHTVTEVDGLNTITTDVSIQGHSLKECLHTFEKMKAAGVA